MNPIAQNQREPHENDDRQTEETEKYWIIDLPAIEASVLMEFLWQRWSHTHVLWWELHMRADGVHLCSRFRMQIETSTKAWAATDSSPCDSTHDAFPYSRKGCSVTVPQEFCSLCNFLQRKSLTVETKALTFFQQYNRRCRVADVECQRPGRIVWAMRAAMIFRPGGRKTIWSVIAESRSKYFH